MGFTKTKPTWVQNILLQNRTKHGGRFYKFSFFAPHSFTMKPVSLTFGWDLAAERLECEDEDEDEGRRLRKKMKEKDGGGRGRRQLCGGEKVKSSFRVLFLHIFLIILYNISLLSQQIILSYDKSFGNWISPENSL